jgi:outer membrane scaffolding protein for murein synthesis (MipA/OmpV family)
VSLFCRSALALLAVVATGSLAAEEAPNEEELPLWELGFGAGVLHTPDYPSSSESRARAIALPYVVYRGEVLRMGDGQVARAVAAETSRFELSMSFDGAFNARSDRNELRRGMPDLDFLFEAGPQMRFKLGYYEFEDSSYGELDMALQVRAVFSTDFRGIEHRGYVAEPMLRYRHWGLLAPQLEANVSLRPIWADRRLHSFFYGVAPEFVTPERPLYEADAGYFGTQLSLYASWHFTDRFQVFGGTQIISHHGAENRDSPLFEEHYTFNIGGGFIWSLFDSKKTVVRPRGR